MTCPTLALRRSALLLADVPDPARLVAEAGTSLRRRFTGEGTVAQLSRFAVVGLTSSALYAVAFLSFGSLGSLAANLIGMVASTLLANELHRRLTFHASAAVSWLRAQLQGGGLAVVGLVATSYALLALQAAAPDAGWFVQVLMIAGITGGIGLMRFVALKAWVFTAVRRARGSISSAPALQL
ncbi:MAG: GtrA family protein [Actinomycetota bacterium]|nr:GtrA family protein [Actinomycetota bacterium]